MILVDSIVRHPPTGLRAGDRWCHMVSDLDMAQLHNMAMRIGLKLSWFQKDHYDLTPARRVLALRHGAIAVTSRELLLRMVGPRGDRVRARKGR